MMATVLSKALTAASLGSTLNPTDTATSWSKRLQTESHCCVTKLLLHLTAGPSTLEEVLKQQKAAKVSVRCVTVGEKKFAAGSTFSLELKLTSQLLFYFPWLHLHNLTDKPEAKTES